MFLDLLRVVVRAAPAVLAVVLVPFITGCGLTPSTAGGSTGPVQVVAAENFWGSIASQVGGSRAHVVSIIQNPDTDPHAYEATPGDARAVAQAQYVIVNGVGYDQWASKLVAANPVQGRQVLTVGDLVGRKEGENPHLWYSPAYVQKVVDQVTADLKRIDPGGADYYDRQNSAYKTESLGAYDRAIAAIRTKYAGTPVGATESIFAYTAQATGLDLVTPSGYMKATSEGTDPSAADKVTVARQVKDRQLRVLVYNSQNTTPDVNAVVDSARTAQVPVVAVTETLSPAGATFQDWQTSQLQALLRALGG